MYYVARNQKWGDPEIGTESGVITWSSNLDSSLNFDEDRYSTGQFQNALQDAFDAWESVSGLDFTYIGSGDANIDVGMGFGNGARFGTVGTASWNGGPTIQSATVTFDDQEIWAPTGSGGIDFYAVALHEIGHTIGLNHYDGAGPSQIMASSISADVLQSGDIAGAVHLYGEAGATAPSDPDDPDTPEASSPPLAADDGGGGGGGGAAGILVALLGALAAVFFGGGAAVIGLAAGSVSRSEENDADPVENTDVADDVLLTDLLPVVEEMSHSVYVDDFGNFIAHPDDGDHGAGCGCGHCCGFEDEAFVA